MHTFRAVTPRKIERTIDATKNDKPVNPKNINPTKTNRPQRHFTSPIDQPLNQETVVLVIDLDLPRDEITVSRLAIFDVIHALKVGGVTVELTAVLGGKAGILSAVSNAPKMVST